MNGERRLLVLVNFDKGLIMEDQVNQQIISAIKTLDDDVYRAWFGIKPPRMFADLASQIGFNSRPLSVDDLPNQFFEDLKYYMGSDTSTDGILNSVRATLNEGWYVTDLASYAGDDGTRALRFVKGPTEGGMGDIDDGFARFMLSQLQVKDLPLTLTEPQSSNRNLLKRNPADPEVSFGDNTPYLSSRTINQIINRGDWRIEETGNGAISFYYQVDGVEFAYPSARLVPNPEDLKLSVEFTPRGRGVGLPGTVAETREFGKSLFPAFDDGHRKQAIDDGIRRLYSFNPRPFIDTRQNRNKMDVDLINSVARQYDRSERNRMIQNDDRDVSFWEWVKGSLALASGVPGVGDMDAAQDVFAAGTPSSSPVTTADDLRDFELLQDQIKIVNERRGAMGLEPTSLPEIEAARRGEN
jgi:hypothetical protein